MHFTVKMSIHKMTKISHLCFLMLSLFLFILVIGNQLFPVYLSNSSAMARLMACISSAMIVGG